ncbi:CLUMA_CG010278, isoform A [Clunio marinus]|uniref:CLUMA_CG010278, isoform A n=1 Tax=Clunio marinus TaxID=568069 RepID=A0A1J1IAZ6_9DIPT|nr:CLUMA_CG010278, isoform A [Clunio marinus]
MDCFGMKDILKKGESGQVIAASRRGLTRRLLCLDIQIDNSVSMLNQDAISLFLKDCDSL